MRNSTPIPLLSTTPFQAGGFYVNCTANRYIVPSSNQTIREFDKVSIYI